MDYNKKLSTVTLSVVLLFLLSHRSSGQQPSINPQALRIIKENLKSSVAQPLPSGLSNFPFSLGGNPQPFQKDQPTEQFSISSPQSNSAASSSFSFGVPVSKDLSFQQPQRFELQQQKRVENNPQGFQTGNEFRDQQLAGQGRNEPSASFGPNLERIGLLGPGEFDVSPYFADPEGRRPPSPPFIPAETLLFTSYPCSSLNSTDLRCDPVTRYRNLDGSCNNFANPTYGRAYTKLQRIFRPHEDPTMMRRLSVTGNLLPSPRVVSERLRDARHKQTQRDHNLLVMALGQLIDHDLTLVPVARDPANPTHELKCPNCNSWVFHPACAPIPISSPDTFFQGEGSPRCLAFTRSVGVVAVDPSGKLYLENVNENTAFLDLSVVYGSHDCAGRRLRAYSGGKLLTTNTPASPYGLPVLASKSIFGECKTKFEQCYNAGDARCNEHPALLGLHTMFVREHNHLAATLHALNPIWEDEKIFQEARRINIAQFQHIVVNEFLPVLLGRSPLLRQYGLLPAAYPATEYQPQLKPQILQEFATAAFRVGHSFVPDDFPLADAGLRPLGSLALFKVFNDPSIMQDTMQGSFIDAILRGLVSTRLQGADLKVVDTLRDQLFVNKTHKFSGGDLFSRNIARGRDHGVAPYTAYRAPCQLEPVNSWEQLSPIIPYENVAKLREAYEHWDDIDLFPGGLAEDVAFDGLVGPTFGCIIAMQFYVLSSGDRFWYDNGYLSPPELASVRQSGVLAKVLSRTLDNSKSLVPSDALRLPSKYSNLPVPAEDLAAVDLRPWLDHQARRPRFCHFRGRDYGAGALVPSSPCLDCRCGDEGNLACQERPVDCGLLDRFVPEALTDEHCFRVCPPAAREPPKPHYPSSQPHPPVSQFREPGVHEIPFFARSAEVDGQA